MPVSMSEPLSTTGSAPIWLSIIKRAAISTAVSAETLATSVRFASRMRVLAGKVAMSRSETMPTSPSPSPRYHRHLPKVPLVHALPSRSRSHLGSPRRSSALTVCRGRVPDSAACPMVDWEAPRIQLAGILQEDGAPIWRVWRWPQSGRAGGACLSSSCWLSG